MSHQNPATLDALKLAVSHHQAGRLRQAERIYREILEHEPHNSDALHLLGVVTFQSGDNEAAAELIGKAIKAGPNEARFHNDLGNVLKNMGKLDEAVACFQRALALDPHLVEAYYNLGIAHQEQGNLAKAVTSYEQALSLKPEHPEALNNLGIALMAQDRLDEAAAALERAVGLKPGYAEAHNSLGMVFRKQGYADTAATAFERALSLNPDYTEALRNLGVARLDQGKPEEAEAALERALTLKPGHPETLVNLGVALQEKGALDQSVATLKRAISLDPDNAKTHNNLGNTLQKKCQLGEAIASYERALALNPENKSAEFNFSTALLLKGDFQPGWRRYESRWDTNTLKDEKRVFSQPVWDASPLHGKTILLHAEQGVGDTFQFVRYARPVARHGGRIILECQASCKKLLETMPEIGAVFEKDEALPDFDVQASLMSLPCILGTTLETIPGGVPYIRPPEDRTAPGQVLSEEKKLKVGLVWAGNPEHTNDRNRSIPLEKFESVLNTGEIRFFSLQVGDQSAEIRRLGYQDQLEDLSGALRDFSDTAAVIAHLDLIISVDTAPAHLAGAMGRAVWTLVTFAPDWRWMLDRSDSPWYPTMKIFRQKKIGDWDGVLAEVKENLDHMVF